jgi:hypothetical protein
MLKALLFAIIVTLSTTAHALSPQTTEFIKKLGYDPNSSTISSISKEVINGYSLDRFAQSGDEMGAREFIAMRDFIRRWHINHEAKYPTPYQKYYLTTEESNAVAEALADSVLNLLNS